MVELRIDDTVRADIARACRTAHAAPLDFVSYSKLSKLKPAIRARQLPRRAHHELTIPYGYKITFEIADVRPERPCRHLMVTGPDRLPEPAAVARIMQEFGYKLPLPKVLTWVTPDAGGRHTVHVVEPLELHV
jgi:hypothetical protein